jgi:hypothetical protein
MGKRSAVVELVLGDMATWAPFNGSYGLLFKEKISRPWKRNLNR